MVEESLDISGFSEEVTKELSARLGEGYRILLRTVTRNNAVRRDSLTIHRDGEPISPVVYLDEAFESYQNGSPVGEVADKIIDMCLDKSNAPDVPPDYLIDYGTVKDSICCRLVNAGMNSKLLSNVPHRDYMDLAVIFTAVSGESDSGFQSTIIQNCLIDIWGLDEDTLYETALENTVRIMGSGICPIESLIRKVTGCEDIPELGMKLYVATNRHKLHGAGVILYPGFLRDFSWDVGGDLYILPSSIHECILLPESSCSDPQYLKGMVEEVNRMQVPLEEVLSNNVYRYDRSTDTVHII